jgi:hypothetical protein
MNKNILIGLSLVAVGFLMAKNAPKNNKFVPIITDALN